MATTNDPKRVMSPRQKDEMLRKEKIVMDERIRGKSFYQIERDHGFHNADRIWRRAVQRAENIDYKRAEAIRLEEMRLDDLQDGIWDAAIGGNARAVEVALKVLERRSKMLGLDFADMVSGQLVEVEQAKARMMGTAFVAAVNALDLTVDQKRAVTGAFFNELRALQPATLTPEDEALL